MSKKDYSQMDEALTLAGRGDFSGLAVIAGKLGSADDEVRIRAAYYCSLIGSVAFVKSLTPLAQKDKIAGNRNQAIWALANIGRPQVIPVLINGLKDADPAIRGDARAALYRIAGKEVLKLLADEEDEEDPDEYDRVLAWWDHNSVRFDPGKVFSWGEPSEPAIFIHRLKNPGIGTPDAVLNSLRNWTGENFGDGPLADVIKKWERWCTQHCSTYEPGRRYFHSHLVPETI